MGFFDSYILAVVLELVTAVLSVAVLRRLPSVGGVFSVWGIRSMVLGLCLIVLPILVGIVFGSGVYESHPTIVGKVLALQMLGGCCLGILGAIIFAIGLMPTRGRRTGY